MILLVEDHALSRQALARQLSLSGYRVMAAADRQDAADLLDRLPFDLVITDLGLPKLSGFELIGRIRLKSPKMPILVVSGEPKPKKSLNGEVEYFRKPVAANVVIEAVKRFTRRPMRLRDHALIRNWPPIWNNFTNPVTNRLRREIGVLRKVRFRNADSKKCFLLIEHQGEFFMGALMFHDGRFGQQIAELLQGQLGHSTTEIGNLDLSHTF